MALTEVKDMALHKTTFIFVRMLTKPNERSLIFCPIGLFQRNDHNQTNVKSIWDNSIIYPLPNTHAMTTPVYLIVRKFLMLYLADNLASKFFS